MPVTFDADAYAAAAAAALDLEIAPAHRPAVARILEGIAVMAGTVLSFPLPEDAEPAPVFRP